MVDLDTDSVLILPKERCLPVVQGLMALLLGMDFTCNVDLFLVTCKVRMISLCVTLFLAHLSRRLTGELIVYPCSVVRPSSVRPSSVVHNFKDLLL